MIGFARRIDTERGELCRAWVSRIDGRLAVAWQLERVGAGWGPGHSRPLRRGERARWLLLRRTPRP